MNEKLEQLFELPSQAKLGILAGTLAIIGTVFYFGFLTGIREEVAALEQSIDGPKGLRTQINQKEGIARNLETYRKEVDRLDVELKQVLAELPDKKEIYQLLSRVSDKARDSGLEIKLFRPQGEQKREFYAEVPVELEVRGTFHQVATFFDEVGRLERIVNLDQFGMGEPIMDEGRMMLKTSVVATSFRFLEESERPSQGDEKDKKRRRKKKDSSSED